MRLAASAGRIEIRRGSSKNESGKVIAAAGRENPCRTTTICNAMPHNEETDMRHRIRAVHMLLVVGSFVSSTALAGCFHGGPPNPWIHVEEPRYEKWERATHRSHVQFQARGEDEQKEYWQWRTTNY